MSTDLALSQSAPEPSKDGPVATAPVRSRRNWVGWLLASAFIVVLFVELGPWPGLITNAIGLSVSSRTSWEERGDVPVLTSPRTPSYRTGRTLTFNDAELAQFVQYCEGVRGTFTAFQERPVDYSGVRSHYRSLVPELFMSLQEQQFSTEDATQWAAYLEKPPPAPSTVPSGFMPFYEDLMLAAVLRQLTTGHLNEMIRYIDWWKSVAEREEAYRRAVLSVADHVPSALRPQSEMRARWRLTGLDKGRQFMVDKLASESTGRPVPAEGAEKVPTSDDAQSPLPRP